MGFGEVSSEEMSSGWWLIIEPGHLKRDKSWTSGSASRAGHELSQFVGAQSAKGIYTVLSVRFCIDWDHTGWGDRDRITLNNNISTKTTLH